MRTTLSEYRIVSHLLRISVLSVVSFLLLSVSAQDAAPKVTVEQNVPVLMRDGTILEADITRPATSGPHPVLLCRTPYNRAGQTKGAAKYARAGYIVVTQDCRGRYGSGGEYESFLRHETNNGRDGYDTVEWAAQLRGSTGKVGTYGASYNAYTQWRLAAEAPPSLVCMAAFSIPARYTDLEGQGAFRPGRRLQWWLATMSPDMRQRAGVEPLSSKDSAKAFWKKESEQWLHFLPWSELPRQFFEAETEHVNAWLENPHRDPWKLHEGVPNITVPNLNAIGWFDHCNGNLLLDRTMWKSAATKVAREHTRVIIGPWSHSGRGRATVGKINFGEHAKTNIFTQEIRWFDHWLKGEDNGVDKDPRARIFVMGDNEWRDETAWPLSRAKHRELHLTSDGGAQTPKGDGRLLFSPTDSNGVDTYSYDPANPVPTLYTGAAFTVPADQSPHDERKDILVYQSEPLTERLEVTGNPVVELYAATDAADTDFFVRLIDVAPDGTNYDVSMGFVRASYRRDPSYNNDAALSEPTPIEPGKTYHYTIRMNPTSIAFDPGHRIRLDITSSDFPNYDRHHNTSTNQNFDTELIIAKQTIHHGPKNPTRLFLPVISNQ
jgi:putative CocE/NonD family hydrolase